ncbi:hypothetical protein L7F22_032299 [Adiantum nelumboides]|nr:hypothetical protein [Adiantum nelumboides]
MDNYGNDMYLSHPSIDFTLLDRPTGSAISARESVAPFQQGDTPFRPFNVFGGAEAASYNNQLIGNDGRYALEAHKNVVMRHASGGFVSFPNQITGVHNFFEQGNQPERTNSGTWRRDGQSAQFLPRVASTDKRVQAPFGYELSSQHDNNEWANAEARTPQGSLGYSKSMPREAMDHSRLMNASATVHNNSRNEDRSRLMNASSTLHKDSRNQAFSSQGVLNSEPSGSSFNPIKSVVPSHHPTIDNVRSFGAQYQKQVENYDVSSQSGVVLDQAPGYNFLGNQVPWFGAVQHQQAVASKQLQGFTRTAGTSELQSQQRLQDLFLAHHLKQLEESRQEQNIQQAPIHFSRTSYSDLLHGPDTPPQQQTTEEYENHVSAVSAENTEAVRWPVDGSLYYQGVISDQGMEQNQNFSSRMSYGEPVATGNYSGNLKEQNGPPLASGTVGQVVPERLLPSAHQIGKPPHESFRSGNQHLTDVQMREFGLGNDCNSDLRKYNQPCAKLNETQYSSTELLMKQKGGSLSQANAFSQSQQYFQELQFAEQRNLLSEPQQAASNSVANFLPQSLNSAKGTLKNGMHQYSSSSTAMNNLVSCMPQKLRGNCLGSVAASGQPQWMTTSLAGSPSRPMTTEMGGQHQVNSWKGLQASQPSRGTGLKLETVPETRYHALGNSKPQQAYQQGSPMLGVLQAPLEDTNTRQQGLYDTQVTAMNSKTSCAGSANQQTSMPLSNGRVQPLSEPTSQFQGAWKKYTPMQFSREDCSLGQQLLDGPRPQHVFQHQTYQGSEAPYYTAAMTNNPANPGVTYALNQLVPEEQLPMKNSQFLEKYVNQDRTATLPTANLMKPVSRHAVKLVPDVIQESQSGSYKSIEPRDILVESQREVPQQVSSCTENISLAHLRGSHSSSSLSPRHFRLGLGPSQDSQHPIDSSWISFPSQQSLSGDLPTSKASHKTSSIESPHRRAVFETVRKDEIELNQGSNAFMNRLVLQSSGTSSSIFINRPPPVLRETASCDTSPTSSFVPGHIKDGTSLFSASTNCYPNEYNMGPEPTQSRDQVSGDISSGQIQTNTSICASHQDAVKGYSGKSSCISNNTRLPDLSADALPMQRKHLIYNSTRLDDDGSGINVMQDCNLNNPSLKQVGNRLSASVSEGMATASKVRVVEHPHSILNNEQEFSGILESSWMPTKSSRVFNDGEQKQDTMQRAAMLLRNSDNWRGEGHSVQASSMQYAVSDQLNAYRATQLGNQVCGSMSRTSSPNMHGESNNLSLVDGGSSHSLQGWRPSQDTNRYQHANSLNSHASETKPAGRNLRKPPLRAFSPSVMRPGMQLSIHDDLGQRQNLRRLEPSARAEGSPESTALPLRDSNKLPSNFGNSFSEPMHAGRRPTIQHPENTRSLAAIDALQQYNASESKSQDTSPPVEHSRLQFNQTISEPMNSKHRSLTCADFEHTNIQQSEKPPIFFPEPVGNKEVQVISCDNQVPLGFNSSTMKEERIRNPVQGPVSLQKSEIRSSLRATVPMEVAPPSKKRKKQLPLLIPWYAAVAQSNIDLPSDSDAEMVWATALNRTPEKDSKATLPEESSPSIMRARKRLITTTESMQRLFPPLLDGLMHGKTPTESECLIYTAAKRALEDASRLVAKTKDQAALAESSPSTMNMSSQGQNCTVAENNELTKCVESFMERVKHLGMELARLDCATSVSELQGGTHELEKLSLVNRLAKHHGIGFTMDSSDSLFIENIFEYGVGARKPPAQRYVTATAMPRLLPEGVRCLSL